MHPNAFLHFGLACKHSSRCLQTWHASNSCSQWIHTHNLTSLKLGLYFPKSMEIFFRSFRSFSANPCHQTPPGQQFPTPFLKIDLAQVKRQIEGLWSRKSWSLDAPQASAKSKHAKSDAAKVSLLQRGFQKMFQSLEGDNLTNSLNPSTTHPKSILIFVLSRFILSPLKSLAACCAIAL